MSRTSSSGHKQARMSVLAEKLAHKGVGSNRHTSSSGAGQHNSVRQRWHRTLSMIVPANVFMLAIRTRRNARMHWATLAFVSKELERDYQHAVEPSILRGVHRFFPATLILLIFNVICHSVSHANVVSRVAAWWGINIGAVLLVILLWCVVSYVSKHKRAASLILTTHGSWVKIILTVLLGVTYMSGWSVTVGNPVWASQYQKVALIIVLNFVYCLPGVRWTRYGVSVAGLMTFLVYVAVASRPHTHAESTALARTIGYMLVSLSLHLFASYQRERSDRLGYLLGKDVKVETHRAQVLLETMLPRKTLRALQSGRTLIADTYVNSTIMFVVLEGFAHIVASTPAKRLITFLNGVYSEFDALCDEHGVYKIETVGEVYMAGAGIPEAQQDHALRVAALALDVLEVKTQLQAVRDRNQNTKAMIPLEVKIGMHSGSVVAGVIGLKKLNYRVFGDTVNTASRMASHGAPGKAHMTKATQQLLQAAGGFEIESRGVINVKGKGAMETFFLLSDTYASEEVLPTTTTTNKNNNNTYQPSPEHIGINTAASPPNNPTTIDETNTHAHNHTHNHNMYNNNNNPTHNNNYHHNYDINISQEEVDAALAAKDGLPRLAMSLPQPHWDTPSSGDIDANNKPLLPEHASISPSTAGILPTTMSADTRMTTTTTTTTTAATTTQLPLPQPLSTSAYSPTGMDVGDKVNFSATKRWLKWWTRIPSVVHQLQASLTNKDANGSSMRRLMDWLPPPRHNQAHEHNNNNNNNNNKFKSPLHPLTLRFRERGLESTYCNRWSRASLRQMQVIVAVFCAVLLASIVVDIVQQRTHSWLRIAFLVRFFYTLAACVGVWLLSLRKRWSQEVMSTLGVCGVAVSLLLAAMRVDMFMGECIVMTMVIALQVLMLACALMFIYAAIASCCAVVVYIVLMSALPRHNMDDEYSLVDVAVVLVELILLVLLVRESKLKNRSWFLLREKLKKQNKTADRLLYDLVPPKIGRLLSRGSRNIVDYYGESTCLFSDIVGFTPLSAQLGALKIVVFLNRLFTDFDNLCDKHKVYKVNTIGDAYVCVAGVPARDPCHALAGVEMSRGMLRAIEALRVELGWDRLAREDPTLADFSMRIGLHTGSVIAGVVGTASLRYEVWGETVQIANRMESSGCAGRVHVSKQCHDFLLDSYDHKYSFEPAAAHAEDGSYLLIEESHNVVNGYATTRSAVGAALQAGE